MKINYLSVILLTITFSFITITTQASLDKLDKTSLTQINGDDQDGKYGKDSSVCVMNISLYLEFYKQWKNSKYKNDAIKDVIKPWRWVFLNCPKGTQNTYVHGVKIVNYMIQNEKDEAIKDKLIDTLMMVYDQRIKYFNKEGYVLGRKGMDLIKLRTKDYEEVYNTFKKSVELEGNKSTGPILVYYFRTTIKMAKTDKLDKSVIVDTYDQISEIVDYNIKINKDNEKELTEWEIVKGYIEKEFEPYATCEDLISIYTKKFEQYPDDINLLKKITKILDKKKCDEEQLFFDASIRLYELEPSPASAFLIGKMFMKKENYSNAVNYLKQANEIEDEDDLADSYYYLAMCYQNLKNYPLSRKYALKSLEVKPDNGNPYILIGDLYGTSGKECGDNDLTKKVAYWAAVDKYIKAKKVDPSVADIANSRIISYSIHFPTLETIFFYDLQEGESYTVECWINEVTTVRAAK